MIDQENPLPFIREDHGFRNQVDDGGHHVPAHLVGNILKTDHAAAFRNFYALRTGAADQVFLKTDVDIVIAGIRGGQFRDSFRKLLSLQGLRPAQQLFRGCVGLDDILVL